MSAATEAVIKAAVQLVYDGMSEAGWHRVRRAVEAMELADREPSPSLAEIVVAAVHAHADTSRSLAEPAASQAAGEAIRSWVEAYRPESP